LDHVIVDGAIRDPKGREFWKHHFLNKDQVSWIEFIEPFAQFVGLPFNDLRVVNIKCLHAILAEQHRDNKEEIVNIEQFGKILDWFSISGGSITVNSESSGAMDASADPFNVVHINNNINNNNNTSQEAMMEVEPSLSTSSSLTSSGGSMGPPNMMAGDTIFDNIRRLLMKSWFHGEIDTLEAQQKIGGMNAGTFLVRFSSSQPGCYTISSLTQGTTSIKHQRVSFVSGKGFNLNNKWYNSLEDIIRDSNSLFIPCAGSKFQSLFADIPNSVIGYTQ